MDAQPTLQPVIWAKIKLGWICSIQKQDLPHFWRNDTCELTRVFLCPPPTIGISQFSSKRICCENSLAGFASLAHRGTAVIINSRNARGRSSTWQVMRGGVSCYLSARSDLTSAHYRVCLSQRRLITAQNRDGMLGYCHSVASGQLSPFLVTHFNNGVVVEHWPRMWQNWHIATSQWGGCHVSCV